MLLQHVGDLLADRPDRIERGARVLEDHREFATAHVVHAALVLREQIAATNRIRPDVTCAVLSRIPMIASEVTDFPSRFRRQDRAFRLR